MGLRERGRGSRFGAPALSAPFYTEPGRNGHVPARTLGRPLGLATVRVGADAPGGCAGLPRVDEQRHHHADEGASEDLERRVAEQLLQFLPLPIGIADDGDAQQLV